MADASEACPPALLPSECCHTALCTEGAFFPIPKQEKMRCQTLPQYTCWFWGTPDDHSFKFLWKLSQRSRVSTSPRTATLEKQNLLGKTGENGWIYTLLEIPLFPGQQHNPRGTTSIALLSEPSPPMSSVLSYLHL